MTNNILLWSGISLIVLGLILISLSLVNRKRNQPNKKEVTDLLKEMEILDTTLETVEYPRNNSFLQIQKRLLICKKKSEQLIGISASSYEPISTYKNPVNPNGLSRLKNDFSNLINQLQKI